MVNKHKKAICAASHSAACSRSSAGNDTQIVTTGGTHAPFLSFRFKQNDWKRVRTGMTWSHRFILNSHLFF